MRRVPRRHEQGTDAPGRSINSVGSGRSAMEQTDWHEQAEQRFLGSVEASRSGGNGRRSKVTRAHLAPPRALGMLRQAFTNGLRGAMRAEIDKDYVKMPVHEIEKKLAA